MKDTCSCKQPTISGCKPEYGWFDVRGNFEGLTTDEEKEANWQRRLKIARKNTKKTIAKTRKPINKKEE